ncbi:hypothetical protein [Thermoleophilum album]|uniref:Uncharacterized protein n=1 Tax=Thermoleophilum album TaxID=29539 RepID=A0A1H6FKM6_THEAL|nr:hypothetical protein [Thermoleophilum album]SEH10393.1 hypothetical protein SAMN02745716_0242 [Thermoleophilum album]
MLGSLRPCPRQGRALALLCAAAASLASVAAANVGAASADASAPTRARPAIGVFGGGSLAAKFNLVEVVVQRGSRAALFAALTNGCDFASGDGVVDIVRIDGLRIGRGGRIRYSPRAESVSDAESFGVAGRRLVDTTITASFQSPGRAAGQIRVISRFVDPRGRALGKCDTGPVAWRAARPPRALAVGNPVPRERPISYYGVSAQRLPLAAAQVPGGTLEIALAWRLPCIPGSRIRQTRIQGVAINGGRFQASKLISERLESASGPLKVAFSHSVSGQLGARGLVGKWRITATVERPNGARSSCSTGDNRLRAVSWPAAG